MNQNNLGITIVAMLSTNDDHGVHPFDECDLTESE